MDCKITHGFNLPEGIYEIIGLSSDILKDEELAKNDITGNQLIIKKK